jgi:hypothetical protein
MITHLLQVLTAAVVPAVVLAMAVSLHVTTWGAFKDSPYEGFHPLRQVRTVVIATLAALAVVTAGGAVVASTLLPALGAVYAVERLATEWWKSIIRSDDQAQYTIPMRLGFRGRPVDHHALRWTVGFTVALALLVAGILTHLAQADFGSAVPPWLAAVTVGGLGGWLTAVGGAWKDAPIEGFSGWKFMRSPAVATAWALPLSMLTSNWLMLSLAAAGLAVASIETYKTFFTGGRAPGKFAGRRAQWVNPQLKLRLGRVHAAGWVAFGAVSILEMLSALRTGSEASVAVATVVAAICGSAGILVLRASEQFAGLRIESVTDLQPDRELVDAVA